MKVTNSKILYKRSGKTLVGEVNSTVRSLKAVGGTPMLIHRTHLGGYSPARSSNTDSYRVFFHSMFNHGIYFPLYAFETIFISTAHTLKDIELCARAAKAGF